jgi:RND family efflux transporter MFP subunit
MPLERSSLRGCKTAVCSVPSRQQFLASAALFGLTLLSFAACTRPEAAPAPPPPPVAVVDLVERDVPLFSEWVATLDGYVNAQIRPEVTGYLVRRTYQEGAMVRKGQVLFEIDPRPFDAALRQSKAQLAQAEAQLARANRDVDRDTPLAVQKAIAQSQLDTDIQTQLANRAAVDAANAALQTAELNVEFTHVRSLVDGVAAIATAQIGDLVGPATLLTTVSQIQPIKAYFPVTEKEYLAMAARIRRGKQPWEANPGPVLTLSDGATVEKGAYLAADREVDQKTGTIRLAVTFPNPMGILRPGQYGRVRVVTGTERRSLVLPQRAITELQGQYHVRIVGGDNKVAVRAVTVGERVGDEWVVTSGLKAGDRVAVDGAQFLRDGTVVVPKSFSPTKQN